MLLPELWNVTQPWAAVTASANPPEDAHAGHHPHGQAAHGHRGYVGSGGMFLFSMLLFLLLCSHGG